MTEIDLKQQLFPRLSWRKKYQEQIGGKSHFTYGGPLCDPRRWRFASACLALELMIMLGKNFLQV